MSIAGINFAFQDRKYCHLVLDLKAGGDLRYHLNKRSFTFSEYEVSFFLLTLISALSHMHSHGVLHRDLKPGNISDIE